MPLHLKLHNLSLNLGICLESEIMELGCKHKFITKEMSLGVVLQLPDKDETNVPWKQIFATFDVFVGALAAEVLVFGETKLLLGRQMFPSWAKPAVTENAIMKLLFFVRTIMTMERVTSSFSTPAFTSEEVEERVLDLKDTVASVNRIPKPKPKFEKPIKNESESGGNNTNASGSSSEETSTSQDSTTKGTGDSSTHDKADSETKDHDEL